MFSRKLTGLIAAGLAERHPAASAANPEPEPIENPTRRDILTGGPGTDKM